MTRITVWDPGMMTGLVQAEYTPTTFPVVIGKFEVGGGLEGVCDLLTNGWDNGPGDEEWVSEKFRMTPRVRTSEQVEPLRIEGAIQLFNADVVWQYPDSMLLAGGHHGSPGRNKTAADNVLRTLGLWTMPSEVLNHKDANDINSAMKHLVAYLRNNGHQPTIEAIHKSVGV